MRRILAVFVTIVILLTTCVMGATAVSAASSNEDFFVYDGVLVEYVGNGGDVVIPNNLGIKEIGEKAFFDNTSIKSVIIPEGITKIGDKAFEGCTLLKTVDLPYSLTELGSGVFRLCAMIEKIVIPGQVKKISGDCFAGCLALSDVVISYGVQEIGVYAFSQTALTNVVIPETVKIISGRAFVNLTASRFSVTICNPSCDMAFYEIKTGDREKGFDCVFEGQSHVKTAISIRSTAGSLVEQYAKNSEFQPSYGKYMFQALNLEDIKALPENQPNYGKQSATQTNIDVQGNTNTPSNNNANDVPKDDSIMLVIIIAAAVILLVIIIAVVVLIVMNKNKKQKLEMQLLLEQLKQKSENESKE